MKKFHAWKFLTLLQKRFKFPSEGFICTLSFLRFTLKRDLFLYKLNLSKGSSNVIFFQWILATEQSSLFTFSYHYLFTYKIWHAKNERKYCKTREREIDRVLKHFSFKLLTLQISWHKSVDRFIFYHQTRRMREIKLLLTSRKLQQSFASSFTKLQCELYSVINFSTRVYGNTGFKQNYEMFSMNYLGGQLEGAKG